MHDTRSIPIVVVSQRPDDAESISQTLRNAGCIANCIGLSETRNLADSLSQNKPLLLFVFSQETDSEQMAKITQVRDQLLPDLPILMVQPRVTEETIAAAMEAGADDLVTLGNKARLQAVSKREISHCQRSRQLHDMEESAHQMEEQIESLVKESNDALMHVQEGIVISINPACADLLNIELVDELIGTPALDLIDESNHVAFKGALVACNQGQWQDHELALRTSNTDGSDSLSVIANLERAMYDEEPCVMITLSADVSKDEKIPIAIVNESEHHPLTGFYRRQRFLSEMDSMLSEPSQTGVTALAYVKLDSIHKVREQLGPIFSDDLLLDFAKILQEQVKKTDLYGQFGGDLFMALLPRGAMRDAIAWAENIRSTLSDTIFEIDDRTISITCTIGLARYQPEFDDVADLVLRAQKAYQAGLRKGGDCVQAPEVEVNEGKHQTGDTAYVQKIKTSLMRDNFRLVYQPVASLDNQDEQLFDVLLRMIDEDNREIMPNTFLPAAIRNGLMKNIDRWVLASAIKFCAHQKQCKLFVRLSYDSVPDNTLAPWIEQQLKIAGVNPSQIIIELAEVDCENHLKEVKELTQQLKSFNCQVAIEHFGVGSQPLHLLEMVKTDFIKVDGSLMEGISGDKHLQAKVKRFVDTASAKGIATVAERVEDANTMAVLWQIGFQYIQGFYVQGPEDIVLEGD